MELANKWFPVWRYAVDECRGTLFLFAWTAAQNHATVSLPALAILLPVVFADITARYMHLGNSRTARATAPIVLAAVRCVPALGAVALA